MKILTKTEVKALVRLYRRWLIGPGIPRSEAYVDGDVCKACSPKYMQWQSRLLWQAEQWLRQTGIPGSPWDVLMRPAAFSGYAPDTSCGDSLHLLRNRDRRGNYDTITGGVYPGGERPEPTGGDYATITGGVYPGAYPPGWRSIDV